MGANDEEDPELAAAIAASLELMKVNDQKDGGDEQEQIQPRQRNQEENKQNEQQYLLECINNNNG